MDVVAVVALLQGDGGDHALGGLPEESGRYRLAVGVLLDVGGRDLVPQMVHKVGRVVGALTGVRVRIGRTSSYGAAIHQGELVGPGRSYDVGVRGGAGSADVPFHGVHGEVLGYHAQLLGVEADGVARDLIVDQDGLPLQDGWVLVDGGQVGDGFFWCFL